MDKIMIKAAIVLATTTLASQVNALQLGKPITTSAIVTNSSHYQSVKSVSAGQADRKEVTLMNIQLTKREQDVLFNNKPIATITSTAEADNNNNLPSQVQLGMNGTPVLDQGAHGTCVTFATTAAIDAVLGKGDYVSQLCSLELGTFLEQAGYIKNAWDGAFGPDIIGQITRFGIVSTTNQRAQSCGMATEYPAYADRNHGQPLTLKKFKETSEDVNNNIYWVPLLSAFERFDARFDNEKDVAVAFEHTKAALAQGHRVTFGTILVLTPYCSVGACANYKASNDTWALTSEIEKPPFSTGGHEMVITGYDDNAVATDSHGKTHKGLFTLRNSWGASVGDQGNFYMSYDYFKKFVMEIQEVATTYNS